MANFHLGGSVSLVKGYLVLSLSEQDLEQSCGDESADSYFLKSSFFNKRYRYRLYLFRNVWDSYLLGNIIEFLKNTLVLIQFQ